METVSRIVSNGSKRIRDWLKSRDVESDLAAREQTLTEAMNRLGHLAWENRIEIPEDPSYSEIYESLSDLQAQIEEHEAEIERLQEERTAAQMEFDSVIAEIDQEIARLEELRAPEAAAVDSLSVKRNKLIQAQEQIASQIESLGALNVDTTSLSTAKGSVDEQLAAVTADYEAHHAKLTEYEGLIAEQRQQRQQAEQELQEKFAEIDSQIAAQQGKIKDKQRVMEPQMNALGVAAFAAKPEDETLQEALAEAEEVQADVDQLKARYQELSTPSQQEQGDFQIFVGGIIVIIILIVIILFALLSSGSGDDGGTAPADETGTPTLTEEATETPTAEEEATETPTAEEEATETPEEASYLDFTATAIAGESEEDEDGG